MFSRDILKVLLLNIKNKKIDFTTEGSEYTTALL
jgi:hypothetical protein